jgi:hypothetical protein
MAGQGLSWLPSSPFQPQNLANLATDKNFHHLSISKHFLLQRNETKFGILKQDPLSLEATNCQCLLHNINIQSYQKKYYSV